MDLESYPIGTIEKGALIEQFERFDKRPTELILDPTCFMKWEYMFGTVEMARSERINRIWITKFLLAKENLLDALYTWKPEGAGEWFAWISSEQFDRLFNELRETGKLHEYPTPESKLSFRKALFEIERENLIGAIVCAEILSFSYEHETPILLPEFGLTDVLKRSGNALIRIFNSARERKLNFFVSLVDTKAMVETKGLRWLLKGSLGLATLVHMIPSEYGIVSLGLWVLDP